MHGDVGLPSSEEFEAVLNGLGWVVGVIESSELVDQCTDPLLFIFIFLVEIEVLVEGELVSQELIKIVLFDLRGIRQSPHPPKVIATPLFLVSMAVLHYWGYVYHILRQLVSIYLSLGTFVI
jgi:hypothetical protein